MANKAPSQNLRIAPRDGTVLSNRLGSIGEIYYDQTSKTLRLYDGKQTGGFPLARNDLANISNSVFLAKASAAGVAGLISSGSTSVTVSSVQPQSGSLGNLWYNSNTGVLFVYANEQWSRSIPVVSLAGYATEDYVDTAVAGVTVDLTGYATESYVDQEINALVIPPAFSFNVAADDDVARAIASSGTVKFAGSGGITTSSDSQGVITITSSGVGNITFQDNDIDSNDSSPITFIPQVVFQSDIIGENDITGLELTANERLSVNGPANITGDLDVNGSISVGGSLSLPSVDTSSITSSTNLTVQTNLINLHSLGIASEALVDLGVTTGGAIDHDTSLGSIFFHNTPTSNFTVNFTNLPTPTVTAYTISIAVIILQSGTARMPIAAQINGVGQTIKWLGAGGTPAGNANQTNVITFTLIKRGITWAVLASSANYG